MFGAVSNRDLENIDKYFQQLIDFLSYEKNEFEYIESTGNKKVDDMFKRWNQQIKSFDKRAKDDMRVLGEIVLTADKVNQGIYKCRIKGNSENPTIDEIFGLANYSLQRDTEWIQMSKDRLSSIEYSTEPNIDNVSLALRKAFDYSLTLQWQKAVDTINEIANVEDNSCTKGYLLQLKAMYLNFLDKSQAQETLLSAHKFNTGLLMPIQGIQYTKSIKKIEQSNAIKKYIDSITDDCNDFIIHVDTILANLIFGSDTEEFEQAMQNLGLLLGFQSTRPEKETKRLGPDNLWAIGNQTYLLIECKSKADNSTLSRDYCNQLGGSVRWFSDEYGKDCKCIPILIHVSTVIDESATAVENMRVINEKKLEILKEQVKNFATALTQNENWHNIDKIKELLLIYKLRGVDLRNEYSVPVVK